MDMFGANNYKVSDLVFYTGLFAGFILTYRGLVGVVDNNIVRLLIGGCVGLALGWGFGFVYASWTQRPKD